MNLSHQMPKELLFHIYLKIGTLIIIKVKPVIREFTIKKQDWNYTSVPTQLDFQSAGCCYQCRRVVRFREWWSKGAQPRREIRKCD